VKKTFIYITLIILSATHAYGQNDTIFLSKQTVNDTIKLSELSKNSIQITKPEKIKSDLLLTPQHPIDTAGLTIDNVILKDLPKIKRMDSIWFKELYQPVLFDSLENIKYQIEQVNTNIDLDTTDFKNKLKLLNQKTRLDIVYHPALERTVKAFLKNRKKSLGKLFGMAEYYFPIFEEKLAKYDIPLEIKYLAIIESALNPRALSKAGAGGLWQFMYSTGKVYGLEINNYVDERFDPLQETEAACKHMQDLYRIFKDWNLVLAAYNSGAGNVTKAIRRSGGYTNYWNIRPYLPRETAGYVPMFQATLFLGEYAQDYGIKPIRPKYHYIATDTIVVKHNITFEQISKLLKISIAELEFLNPQYKLNIIPYVEDQKYTLKLPVELTGVYVANEKLIQYLVEKEFKRKEKPLPKFYKINNYIVYRVRSGDYLGRIAQKFHTTVRQIKRWNHLRSDKLRIGQKLRIYSRYAIAVSGKKENKNKKYIPHKGKYITYKVKPGDTLWNISRKYNVSLTDIMQWNQLKKHDKIKPGMTLKIYKS